MNLLGKCAVIDSCEFLNCKPLVQLAINYDETVPFDPGMFLEEPWCRSLSYTARDGQGREILQFDNSLRGEFQFRITAENGLNCNANMHLKVRGCGDLFRPGDLGRKIVLNCTQSSEIDAVGLPIPDSAIVDTNGRGELIIENWATCHPIKANYSDWVTSKSCSEGIENVISRKWRFTGEGGALYEMEDSIIIEIIELADIPMLPDYDGVDQPIIDCDGAWNKGDDIPPIELTGSYASYSLCNNIFTQYQDIVIDVFDNQCFTYKKVLRKWLILDWCTNDTREDIQIIVVQCGMDSSPPVANCVKELNVELDEQGVYRLFARTLDDGSTDDCAIESFSFSPKGSMPFIDLTFDDTLSIKELSFYVYDYTWAIDSCIVKVNVTPNSVDEAQVGGIFLNYELERLDVNSVMLPSLTYRVNAGVDNLIPDECAPPPNMDLDYTLCWDSAKFMGPYSLSIKDASTTEEFLDGVNVLDVLRIRQGLLNGFPNRASVVAGDVYAGGGAGSRDFILLTRIIIGVSEYLGPLWTFLTEDDQGVPYALSYRDFTPGEFDLPIIPVRIGDLDRSGLSGIELMDPHSSNEVVIYMVDRVVEAGVTYDVDVYADGPNNIMGIQWGIDWSGQEMQLNGVELVDSTLPPVFYNNEDAELKTIQIGAGSLYNLDGNFLRLNLRPLVSGMLSDIIRLDSFPMELIAGNENFDPCKVRIEWRDRVVSANSYKKWELQVYPNPVRESLFIRSNETIESWELMDLNGKVMMRNKAMGGNDILSIDLSDVTNGMYILHVINSKNKESNTVRIIKD